MLLAVETTFWHSSSSLNSWIASTSAISLSTTCLVGTTGAVRSEFAATTSVSLLTFAEVVSMTTFMHTPVGIRLGIVTWHFMV